MSSFLVHRVLPASQATARERKGSPLANALFACRRSTSLSTSPWETFWGWSSIVEALALARHDFDQLYIKITSSLHCFKDNLTASASKAVGCLSITMRNVDAQAFSTRTMPCRWRSRLFQVHLMYPRTYCPSVHLVRVTCQRWPLLSH